MSASAVRAEPFAIDEPIAAARTPRVSTGVAGLDRLLGGGLIRGNSLLLEGPPGSGKSTLGIRIVHEGIVRHHEPALIIAFEEFPRQIYREALCSGVDLRAHEEAGMLRVLWTPPARILEGFNGRDDLVERIVQEMGVQRVLIDSITHFKRVASSELELREILATMLCNLKLRDVSTFLVKELELTGDRDIAFEEYLVDASVRLHHDPAAGPSADASRLVEVRKTRGQGHVSGRHPFELDGSGISVYPQLHPDDVERLVGNVEPRPLRLEPLGVPGLDDMLGGGVTSGSLVLVSGPAGAGRSALARQFLGAAVDAGERALLVSLNGGVDPPWAAAARGDDGGRLQVLDVDPAWSVEKIQDALLREVARSSPARIAFDGLEDLLAAGRDATAVARHVMVLGRLARTCRSSVLVTEGAPGSDVGTSPHARLASTVVQLRAWVAYGELHRSVLVSKHAGHAHATDVREYVLTRGGLRVEAAAARLGAAGGGTSAPPTA